MIRESYGRGGGGIGIYVRPVDGPTALYPDLAWWVTCDRRKSGAHNVVIVGRVRESTSMCQRMGSMDCSYAGLTGQEKVEG